jgi:peptide/nickel transport system permease protein
VSESESVFTQDQMERPSGERTSTLVLTRQVSYMRLIYWRFLKNKLAVFGFWVLMLTYLTALFAGFVAPYTDQSRFLTHVTVRPQMPRFVDAEGKFHLRPFVYLWKAERDPFTFKRMYTLDTAQPKPIRFFVRGEEYKLLVFRSNIHLFGIEGGQWFPLGTDTQGRDLFSRIIYGGRVSTSVGLVGVFISIVLGVIIGMFSGFVGGMVDTMIQRVIEVLVSFPSLPLWLALSAAVPRDWSSIRIFFMMTVILSFLRWGGLARIVRGMTLALRNEEYVLSSRVSGGSTWWIIRNHMLPTNMSYVIVSATMSVPGMILGETALSFLGLGIRPPMVSWGTLLQDSQSLQAVSEFPWLMTPVFAVIFVVLAFNFMGDGLRDAIDPHGR